MYFFIFDVIGNDIRVRCGKLDVKNAINKLAGLTYPSTILHYIINIFEVPCPLCEMLYCNDVGKRKFLYKTWLS